MSDSVSTTRNGRVAAITLDDGKANALKPAVLTALAAALDAVAASDAGALVLAGRSGFFSAGLDLKVMPTLAPPERAAALQSFARLLVQLFMFPRPVVAAVTGHALGGGALLALAADVRMSAEGGARFGLTEVPLGMAMPTFGSEIARASVPVEHLAALVLHGRILSPAEALAWRCTESLHAPDALVAAAHARAEALAALPSTAYAASKTRLRGAAAELIRASLDAEITAFSQAVGTAAKP